MSQNDQQVPVLIVSVNPFRLVLRDDDDVWNADWEQINSKTYDYVKLNRLSTFIDAGLPKPYPLAIGFDGSFVLPAIPQFLKREKATLVINDILGKMLLGGIYFEAAAPEDINPGQLYFNGYYRLMGHSSPQSLFHTAIRTLSASPIELPRLIDPRTVYAKALHEAFNKGAEIAKNVPTLSLSILLNGVTYHIHHQWAQSLTNLWVAIEQVISHIWETKIVESSKPVSITGRKDFLKDHKSWSVSTRSELLFQCKTIDRFSYQHISQARKARNDFIHRGVMPSRNASIAAIEGLFRLISRVNSDYRKSTTLSSLMKILGSHDRILEDFAGYGKQMGKVIAWRSIPPIPGDVQWGARDFETFRDIQIMTAPIDKPEPKSPST